MGTFWLVLLVVIIAAGVLIVRWQLHKRKVAAFTAFATGRGWVYREKNNNLTERYLGTPFGQGFGKQAEHVLTGSHRGRSLVAFEYSYKEHQGSGKNRRTVTYRNTVLALETPAARPTLTT